MTIQYTEDHEWVQAEGDQAVVGITVHAQDALGDVVFVDLPEVGKTFAQKDVAGVVESVKAASDVYMPLGGTITAANNDLEGSPEIINKTPFGDGWLIRIKPDDVKDLDKLLDAKAYGEFLETEEGH